MKTLLQLTLADLRRIFRDKTLLVFLTTPLFLILFVRYFVPYITAIYPVISEYNGPIMMFASAQTAIMFGFISAFIILDEKDENVLQVIRVLPVSSSYFILFRMIFATLFSFVGSLGMMLLAGIAYPGLLHAVLLSVQFALTAPFIALIVATYAKNKIEGMAFFKGVDLVLIVPVLSFFVSGWMKYLFGIVPVFWTFQAYNDVLLNQDFWFHFLIGSLCYVMVIGFFVRQFRKLVFDR